MGQKVHPVGFRLGYTRNWDAQWFASRGYTSLLLEDMRIRDFLRQRLQGAMVSAIEISRRPGQVQIRIHSARPGLIIGRRGQDVEKLIQELKALTGKQVQVDVVEIQKPDLEAYLVAEQVASQISKRVAFRRAMRQAAQRVMNAGARGVKIICAGRLAGSEMARRHVVAEGKMPLQTLRANIDYGFTEAPTVYGNIGVKVWIYKGDVLPERPHGEVRRPPLASEPRGGRGDVDAATPKVSQAASGPDEG